MKQGGNYAFLPGDNTIIETDTPELDQLCEECFPQTLTQRSPGHKTRHFIYSGRIPETKPLLDKSRPKDRQNIGHIKTGNGTYILGAGSIHPNGGVYELVDRRPRAQITQEQIHAVLGGYLVRRAKLIEETEARKYDRVSDFSVKDLLPRISGIKETSGGQLQGPHPTHGSTTGSNFSVNPSENVWHCFRCESGGGPYQLLAVLEGILDCEDSVPGALRGEKFRETRRIALDLGYIKRAPARLANGDGQTPELSEDAKPHEIADAILTVFQIVTLAPDDKLLIYQDGRYFEGGEALVRRVVEEQFTKAEIDQVSTNHFVNEVIGRVQRRSRYAKPEDFDKDPVVLNLQNGLLNVETGEFKPHSSDYLSRVQLPVTYDPNGKSEAIDEFFREILDPGDIPTVQEFTGGLLWRHFIKKALMLIGEGDNAKSTLINLIKAFLGPENIAARSLQDFENNRFAKADLYGKLANLYADLPDTALKSTGIFKILTGGDPVTAEHKFGQPFTFVPYAKEIYSCNVIPEAPDDTPAFFGRWIIIKFPNAFPEGDPRRNPRILEELTTPENLSGFLNWALAGLKRLRENSFRFTAGKTTDAIRREYIRRSNPVAAFIEECCKLGSTLEVRKDALYRAYDSFCQENKFVPLQLPSFYTRLVGKFETIQHKTPDGKRPAFLVGLDLRTSQEREAWKQQQQTLDSEVES